MGLMDSIFGPRCTGCARRTRNKVNGQAVCPVCETEQAAALEPIMACPKCHAVMSKEIQQTIIYDKCSDCGGVWLDKTELESLATMASAKGQASGQACGVMMGMAMAPHHSS